MWHDPHISRPPQLERQNWAKNCQLYTRERFIKTAAAAAATFSGYTWVSWYHTFIIQQTWSQNSPPEEPLQISCLQLVLSNASTSSFNSLLTTSNHVIFSLPLQLWPSCFRYSIHFFSQTPAFLCRCIDLLNLLLCNIDLIHIYHHLNSHTE